jgi:hypothetical protein
MRRRRLLVLLASAALGRASVLPADPRREQQGSSQAHSAWVADVLERMETIKPGMKRKDLLTVFATEGGLSTGLRRTFVSRECPYFKVEFQGVGRGRIKTGTDG